MATASNAVWVILFITTFGISESSLGDRLHIYQHCLRDCADVNCTNGDSLERYESRKPLIHRLTLWHCLDECKYSCMWKTVGQMVDMGQSVPQFHGKWPFRRFLGLQEPASVFFSILNLLAFFHLFVSVRTKIPREAPMWHVWLFYSGLGIFTWSWSAIFHGRDTPLTERMDYFCAFGCVLFSFYACLVRVASGVVKHSGTVFAVPLLSFYFYHIWYLTSVNFDYGYNMTVNVAVGVSNSVGWLIWSAYMKLAVKQNYVADCFLVTVLVNLFILLELLDFPPFLWIFDAHSLWHLVTVPLPILWTRFVIEDCRYQLKKQHQINDKVN